MAHFAEINSENKVTRVIVADTKEWCETHLGGTWVQTSYNTRGGVHYNQEGEPSADQSKALHKNYAGIGDDWDGIGFSAPQPHESAIKNLTTYLWEMPGLND